MNLADTLKRLLEQIAESAYEASAYASRLVFDDNSLVTDCSTLCEYRELPAGQSAAAVELATRIRPGNAPTLAHLKRIYGDSQRVDPKLLSRLTTRFWEPDRNRLSVSFIGDVSSRLKARFMMHLNSWTEAGGIHFGLTGDTGEVRSAVDSASNWSYTGTDIRLVPEDCPTTCFSGLTMDTSDRDFAHVVQHQAGHLLGLPHRPPARRLAGRLDRDRAIRFLEKCSGWSRRDVELLVFSDVLLEPSETLGARPSVMQWPLPDSLSVDGQAVSGPTRITEFDKEWVRSIYHPRRQA